MKDNREIAARVKAQNKANSIALEVYALLAPIFTQFIGQKVTKADGSLLAKVAKLFDLSQFQPDHSVTIYKYSSDYSLMWVVKVCQQVKGTHHCHYEDFSVYIADLKGGVIDSIYDPLDCRTDYTVEEIERLRADYEEKKKEADKAKSKLHPFGENDR